MANPHLSRLLAALAEDFDISVEYDEGNPDRATVEIRATEAQLQAATTRVVAARAALPIAEAEVRTSMESSTHSQ